MDIGRIGLAIKRLQVRHQRVTDERLAPMGISIAQWDALRHLHHNPDASLHDLAQLTFQTDQAFGALAGRMIDRGLIERRPEPGRAIRHRLTDKGEELRVQAEAVLNGVLHESLSPLTTQQLRQLDTLLRILVPPPETKSQL